MIAAFELAKTVHALDRSATVTGCCPFSYVFEFELRAWIEWNGPLFDGVPRVPCNIGTATSRKVAVPIPDEVIEFFN
jgi:hypothetical protein